MKPIYCFFVIFVFIIVVTYLLSLVLIRIFTEKIRETGPTSVIVKLHQDGKQINRFHIRKPLTNTKPVQIETFDAKQLVQKIRSPPRSSKTSLHKGKGKRRESRQQESKRQESKRQESKRQESKRQESKRQESKRQESRRQESKPRRNLREDFANPPNQGDRYLHQYARDYRDINYKFKKYPTGLPLGTL